MKAIKLFAVLGALSIFSSCQKNDDVSESERGKALLGQWEYQAIVSDKAIDINGDGTVNIDLYNTQEMQQCIKDNLTFFTEMGTVGSGTYAISENALACDQHDPYSTVEEDNYTLVNNSIIQFEVRNEMRIIELTKSKLVIETNDNLDDQDVVVTITYKKG